MSLISGARSSLHSLTILELESRQSEKVRKKAVNLDHCQLV